MQTLDVIKDEVECITETTNNILHITCKEGEYFFRRCRLHGSKYSYYAELVKEYIFWSGARDADILYDLPKDRARFKQFWNMGLQNDPKSLLHRFMQEHDYRILGLDNVKEKIAEESLLGFIEFVWGEISTFKQNIYLHKEDYQTGNACKCLAYKRISDFLGLSFVPDSRLICLKIDQYDFIGLLVEACEGKSANNCTANYVRESITPMLQRKLLELNCLDVLCAEKDHAPNNYFLVFDERGKCQDIKVFDNDSVWNFFPYCSATYYTYSKAFPLIDNNGLLRPCFPREILRKLQGFDWNLYDTQLSKFITKNQFRGILRRVHSLKRAFEVSRKENVLLNYTEWNDTSVEEELQYAKGTTYLQLLYRWIK